MKTLVKQDVTTCFMCKGSSLRIRVYTDKIDKRRSSQYPMMITVIWCHWCGYHHEKPTSTELEAFAFSHRCVACVRPAVLCDCDEVNGMIICRQVKKFSERYLVK